MALGLVLTGCSVLEVEEASTADASSRWGGRGTDPEADRRAAQQIVLRLADLPAGSSGKGAATSEIKVGSATSGEASVAQCLDVPEATVNLPGAWAESPALTAPDLGGVDSRIVIAATVSEADAATAIFHSPRMPECMDSVVKARAVGQTDVTHSVEPLEFAKLGDDSVALRAAMSKTFGTRTSSMYLDFVRVRVGRVQISMEFSREEEPFPTAEAERLTRIVIDRLSRQ